MVCAFIDGIREIGSISYEKSEITIKKAELSDVASLEVIDEKHNVYYRLSPLFMPVKEENSVKHLTQRLSEDDHLLRIAYDGDKVIG